MRVQTCNAHFLKQMWRFCGTQLRLLTDAMHKAIDIELAAGEQES